MKIEGLKLELLPAPAIIKNFIKNDPKCNYELYLTELVNSSKWFSERLHEKFVWCSSQSNQECDVYSGNYGLDFKLVAAQTRLQARSIFSPQITVFNDGVVAYSISKVHDKSITATRLHAALRTLSIEDLKKIRAQKYKHQGMESDVQSYLETLETPKNLMLFFPYRFHFDSEHKQDHPIETLIEALNHDFNPSFSYRALQGAEYDTFFVTLYCDDFLLMKITNGTAHLIEMVATDKCPTFTHLMEYHDYGMIGVR